MIDFEKNAQPPFGTPSITCYKMNSQCFKNTLIKVSRGPFDIPKFQMVPQSCL